ncbi:uncharacterized protein [Magallana gigas]|uniref:uncharacterized protein isoform X1 n=2 Tax=Magallana gigas TaxID=29159 RepID=UPI00333FDF62
MTHYKNIKFGVDLVKASQAEYDFLVKVRHLEYLRNDAVLQYAVRRYEKVWLPLVAFEDKISPQNLEPPIDIAWVWHCHMLSPHEYTKYCRTYFRKVLDHSIIKADGAYTFTKGIWSRNFPDEPFELDQNVLNELISCTLSQGGKTKSFDLVAATHRQQDFVYNILLPHYRDPEFLKSAITRYKKYLYLYTQKNNLSNFLVPCYDIDFVWHTHQLHPIDYQHVTESLLGCLLTHDDTDCDRNPGSKLFDAYKRTEKNWRELYNESFAISGAVFRGLNLEDKLYRLTVSDMDGCISRKGAVVIDFIAVTTPVSVNKETVKIKIFKINEAKELRLVQKLKSKMENMTWNNQNLTIRQDSTESTLLIELSAKRTFINGGSLLIGRCQQKFGFYLQNPMYQNGGVFSIEKDMQMFSTLTAAKCKVSGSILSPSLGNIELVLEQGEYEEINMSTNVNQLSDQASGPISDAMDICQVALHRLRSKNGKSFICRVIHNVQKMTSVLQFFFEDKLAAIAHFIGNDQLPEKSQISKGSLSLSPSAGEKAILIKTGEGDSTILVVKRGSRVFCSKEDPLKIKVYQLGSTHLQQKETIYVSQYSSLEYEGLTLELKKVAAGLHLPFLTNNKYYGYGVEKPKRQKTYQRDSAFTGGGPKRTYQSDSAFTGGGPKRTCQSDSAFTGRGLKMTYQSDLAFFSAGGGFGGSGCCGGCGGCGGC